MDAELKRTKLEELVDDIAEGVRLNQADRFEEALDVLIAARNAATAWQHRSAFLEWHIAIAYDGLGNNVAALRLIASALAMDHFVPPFRASCEIIVGNARRALFATPLSDTSIRALYKGLVRVGGASLADHLRAAMHYSMTGDGHSAIAILDSVLARHPECQAAEIGRAALTNGLVWRGDETGDGVGERADRVLAEALAKGAPEAEA